jgi:carbon-monoxide dehydrogenase medium subunit
VKLLSSHGGEAKVIAGGQSLMPMLAFRLAAPKLLVDIGRLDLKRIDISPDGIEIGALVRWRDIERNGPLARAHPLLAEIVRHIAHYQIRNRGTVGGSLAHADPAAELPGLALVCDAIITAVGSHGARTIAAAEFFNGPLTTALNLDELLVSVRRPGKPTDAGHSKNSPDGRAISRSLASPCSMTRTHKERPSIHGSARSA